MLLTPRPAIAALLLTAAACGADAGAPSDPLGAKELPDTGWIASNMYEVGATFKGTITVRPGGDFANVATDRAQQEKLVDQQLKYGKNDALAKGWRLNQLAESFVSIAAATSGENVTLTYEIRGELSRKLEGAEPPKLADVPERTFTVRVPLDPRDVFSRGAEKCATPESDTWLREANYYYYFTPDKAGCELPLASTSVAVDQVYARPKVYPEYDRLRVQHGDTIGFRVAIVPSGYQPGDGKSFSDHRTMLEETLKLKGESVEDGAKRRYLWTEEGATITIDLVDLGKVQESKAMRDSLRDYEFVDYDGHSIYGTLDYLTDPAAFSSGYQIVMMHSCLSQEYYARRILRSKATPADPTGFDNLDFVGTLESSYFAYSPDALRVILQNLMKGIVAAGKGRAAEAPTWLDIATELDKVNPRSLYGVAAVRANAWPNGASVTGATPDAPADDPVDEGYPGEATSGTSDGSSDGVEGAGGGPDTTPVPPGADVPSGWTCDASWYGDVVCDCACGAPDVDCGDGDCG